MRITLKQIEKMNPCKDRLANFVRHNPNFKGSLIDFLMLESVTYSDKVWVCVRLMTVNQKFSWARSVVYSVLDIFETQYPNDTSVRELLDYLNTIDNVEGLSAEQLAEIRRLRNAASDSYSTIAYAAIAVAYAAASAASDSAASAVAAASAASYAFDYNSAGTTGRPTQEEFNLIILQYIMEMDI